MKLRSGKVIEFENKTSFTKYNNSHSTIVSKFFIVHILLVMFGVASVISMDMSNNISFWKDMWYNISDRSEEISRELLNHKIILDIVNWSYSISNEIFKYNIFQCVSQCYNQTM